MLMRPDGRLTRQGRLVRTFLFLTLAMMGVVVGSQAFADGPTPLVPTDTYTVSAGETLWGIAGGLVGPGESTRDIVDEIIALNDLESATIFAGDQLRIPVAP
jgi:LysM repeat protein